MSVVLVEENKALVRRFYEEAWNRGNVEVMDELFSPDCLSNGVSDLAASKALIRDFRNAIPDLKITIVDMIAEGDRVVTRWTMSGTNPGPGNHPKLGLLPPAGKPFSITGITIHRITAGRIVEETVETSWTDMLIQIGAIAMPS